MALTSRRVHGENEEESVFVSMTDLMISILFIVMIVMAFFAKSARENDPQNEIMQRQIIRLQQENEDLRAEISLLEANLKSQVDLESRIEALRKDNSNLREELAEVELKNDVLQEEILTLTQQIVDLDRRNERLRAQIKKLQEEMASLKAELVQLRQRLEVDPLETALNGISKDRKMLLSSIQDRLIKAGIKVIVDEVSGVIRFGEDAISFASGSANPDGRSSEIMRKIADILSDEMKCFSMGEYSQVVNTCNPNASIIEAVQIEGHTDMDGTQLNNLKLSTERAASTYQVMVSHKPILEGYLNANFILDSSIEVDDPGQQVLSVSGYGETRLVDFGTTKKAKRANRRIDIRFIMTTPKNIREVELLKSAVRGAVQPQEVSE